MFIVLLVSQHIQLEPGTVISGTAGIVQVLYNNQWGTVCHHEFDLDDAKVACRQLGFTKAVGSWQYGHLQSGGKVWLDYMACIGSESSLQSCSHNGWGRTNSHCSGHAYDAVVMCSGYKGTCKFFFGEINFVYLKIL